MNKLKKIIEFAVENGWDRFSLLGDKYKAEFNGEDIRVRLHAQFVDVSMEEILFNHDFAKAVFGESMPTPNGIWDGWAYHIKEAVMSKDPIDYYYKYISDKGKNK